MKLFIKAIIVIAAWSGISYFQAIYEPLLVADVGVGQLENTDASFTELHGLQRVLSYMWVLYILIPVIVFWKDIKKLTKKQS